MKGLVWTAEENKFVSDHYQKMTDKQIGEALGRTQEAVRVHRREKLRLTCYKQQKRIYWGSQPQKTPVDIGRRILFVAVLDKAKKLIGDRKPKIDFEELLESFRATESELGI